MIFSTIYETYIGSTQQYMKSDSKKNNLLAYLFLSPTKTINVLRWFFAQRVMVFNQHFLPSHLVVSSLRTFIDPVIVRSMFMLWTIFVTVCGVYICIVIVSSSGQEGLVGIPLTGLSPPYICVCPKVWTWIYSVKCRLLFLLCSVSWDGRWYFV